MPSKGRRVPERERPIPLHVVGPWIRSIGGDLEKNLDRLITVGWKYWAAIAYRGYAAEGPGVVAIKLSPSKPSLPADALMLEAAWTPLSAVPPADDKIHQHARELAATIDPLFGIVFVVGYEPEQQARVATHVADVLHEQYAELMERQGLVDRVGVVGAMDLIEGFESGNVTPSA
jgi:hypothetical protein